MSVELKLLPVEDQREESVNSPAENPKPKKTAVQKSRARWQRRMISVERGLKLGFRGDTTFFAHFFVGTILIATCLVLGFSMVHWAIFAVAVSMILSAEMFHQVMKAVWKELGRHLSANGQQILDISHAAVFVSMIGGGIVILLLYVERIMSIFLE